LPHEPLDILPARAVHRARGARRRALGPRLVVAGLLLGSFAAYAVAVEPIAAQPQSSARPVEPEAFRTIPAAAAAEASPSPVGALGVRPRPPIEVSESTPAPPAPAVVRFRPRDGGTGVARYAPVSVRFTQPMDHATTERAFAASIDGAALTGTYRWAEGDTVVVLKPASPLPYGAKVRLAVGPGALSRAGAALASASAVTFTVVERPAPTVAPAPTSRAVVSGWRWPLIGPITQRFGESLTQYGVHQGIDIDGDTGDPVRAARSGRVVVAGHYDDCGGNEVHIDHGDGLTSWYRHLSRIDVKVGARIDAGTIIGAVGDTGCSLGSHLHFAIRAGKVFVDPLRYLPAR
jgi:murein DD-endopeptidase MepM/ murein hydrolase activator NlpD